MRILICMKLVSQAQFTDFLRETVPDRLQGGQLGLNPADMYTLELALRRKDAAPDTHITVLSMGPEAAEVELRKTLAMGADEAVLVSDPAFAGADTLRTSAVLAAAIRRLETPDLILCGQKALDSETGHIGPQLAVRLRIPAVTNVTALRHVEAGFELDRAQDNGMVRLWAPLPFLATVCLRAELVRNPSLAGMRRSRDWAVRRLDAAALAGELLSPSGTETAEIRQLRFARRAHRATDQADEGLEELLRLLPKREGGQP